MIKTSSKLSKYIFIFALFHFAFQCENEKSSTEKTYLALGDSYTIGESVAEKDRYPNILAKILTDNGINLAEPQIIAKTGWTTDELKKAMDEAKIFNKKFDKVSLLIGVNNQYRGRDVEVFRNEFAGLLADAITLAGNKPKNVFVVSIPDWGITPFGKKSSKLNISKNIDIYNQVKKEETLKKAVVFVDITGISREADTDLTLIADDGLHPSGKMYRLWAEKIVKEIFPIK